MVYSLSHFIVAVIAVSTICTAFQHAVMAIDLSRLYGHLNNKRSGKLLLFFLLFYIHILKFIFRHRNAQILLCK